MSESPEKKIILAAIPREPSPALVSRRAWVDGGKELSLKVALAIINYHRFENTSLN